MVLGGTAYATGLGASVVVGAAVFIKFKIII
jgi:hypothetical protein